MKNIASKLVYIMNDCGYIQKDADNKEQRYKYVSAAAVLEKVNAALVASRVVSIPEYTIVSEKEKATSRGGIWQLVTVQCKLMLIDADSGESVTIVSLGTGTDPGDKAVAKAQTMALKYAWLTALNIETGDDPEADPNTDKQVFMKATPPAAPAGLPDSPRVQEILRLWHGLGWDINTLPGYLEQRYGKSSNQLTEPELAAIENEANQYYQQMR
jgi:hypothetical protein